MACWQPVWDLVFVTYSKFTAVVQFWHLIAAPCLNSSLSAWKGKEAETKVTNWGQNPEIHLPLISVAIWNLHLLIWQ